MVLFDVSLALIYICDANKTFKMLSSRLPKNEGRKKLRIKLEWRKPDSMILSSAFTIVVNMTKDIPTSTRDEVKCIL